MFDLSPSFTVPTFSIPKCEYGYNAFTGKCNDKPPPKAPSKPWILGGSGK